ncbi:MAG: threonine/serine exporter family protein [Clostridia bacterium]|nr:threonine/serine exporter family protein [Clostridia bacterium]
MKWSMLIEVLASFVGTLGFGYLFNIRGRKLVYAALGGMAAWALFLGLGFWIESEVLRYFIVSVCSTVYAEVLARRLKTPATTFCIITLIPLVPGGALYYTTTTALSGNLDLFIPRLTNTVQLAVALSLGIVIVTAACRLVLKKK